MRFQQLLTLTFAVAATAAPLVARDPEPKGHGYRTIEQREAEADAALNAGHTIYISNQKRDAEPALNAGKIYVVNAKREAEANPSLNAGKIYVVNAKREAEADPSLNAGKIYVVNAKRGAEAEAKPIYLPCARDLNGRALNAGCYAAREAEAEPAVNAVGITFGDGTKSPSSEKREAEAEAAKNAIVIVKEREAEPAVNAINKPPKM